jgi:hypothetical protein
MINFVRWRFSLVSQLFQHPPFFWCQLDNVFLLMDSLKILVSAFPCLFFRLSVFTTPQTTLDSLVQRGGNK